MRAAILFIVAVCCDMGPIAASPLSGGGHSLGDDGKADSTEATKVPPSVELERLSAIVLGIESGGIPTAPETLELIETRLLHLKSHYQEPRQDPGHDSREVEAKLEHIEHLLLIIGRAKRPFQKNSTNNRAPSPLPSAPPHQYTPSPTTDNFGRKTDSFNAPSGDNRNALGRPLESAAPGGLTKPSPSPLLKATPPPRVVQALVPSNPAPVQETITPSNTLTPFRAQKTTSITAFDANFFDPPPPNPAPTQPETPRPIVRSVRPNALPTLPAPTITAMATEESPIEEPSFFETSVTKEALPILRPPLDNQPPLPEISDNTRADNTPAGADPQTTKPTPYNYVKGYSVPDEFATPSSLRTEVALSLDETAPDAQSKTDLGLYISSVADTLHTDAAMPSLFSP